MSVGDSGSSDWELIDENREEVDDDLGEYEDDQLIVMRRESLHLLQPNLNLLAAPSEGTGERIGHVGDVSESEESDFVRLDHDDDTILMDASGSSSISDNFSFVNRDGILFMDRNSLTESDHALLADDERCSEEESLCIIHRLKNNRHVPNCQLNNSLNFVVMIVCVAFFSFLSGHFIGMHEMAAEKRLEYHNKMSSFVPVAELERCQLDKSLAEKKLRDAAIPAEKPEESLRRPPAVRFDTVLFAEEWHRYCHREEAPMDGFCLSKPCSGLSCTYQQPYTKQPTPSVLPSTFVMFSELRTSLANLKKDLVTQNDLKVAIEHVATMLPKQVAPIHDNESSQSVEYENKTTSSSETKGFSTSYLVKKWNDLKQKARQVRDTVTKHIGESRGNLTCHWNKLKHEAVFVKEKVKSALDGAMVVVRNLSLFTPAFLQFPHFPMTKAAAERRQELLVPRPERPFARLPVTPPPSSSPSSSPLPPPLSSAALSLSLSSLSSSSAEAAASFSASSSAAAAVSLSASPAAAAVSTSAVSLSPSAASLSAAAVSTSAVSLSASPAAAVSLLPLPASSSLMCPPLSRPSSFATMKDWLNWLKHEQTRASKTILVLVQTVNGFGVDDLAEEPKNVHKLVGQLEKLNDTPEGKPWVQCQLTWWRETISGNSVDIVTPTCSGWLAFWQKQTPNSDWYFRRMADRESHHQWNPSPQWLFQRSKYRETQRRKGEESEWWFNRQQMRSYSRSTKTRR